MCRGCMKRYILSKNIDECPECKNPWTDDYIATNMPRSFISTELKEHRKNRLLDSIKSELPHYQEDAARYKKAIDLMNKYNELKQSAASDLKDKYKKAENEGRLGDAMALKIQYNLKKTANNITMSDLGFPNNDHPASEKFLMRSIIHISKTMINTFGEPIRIDEDNHFDAEINYDELKLVKVFGDIIFGEGAVILGDVLVATTKVVQKCPLNDCKGYLKQNWECGLCAKKVCNKCLQEKHAARPDRAHECNNDDIETVKLIKKETRQCPGCNTHISKIDGCNQMWCVECHTTFDWITGSVVKGKTHNPHYYEWLRATQGSVPRDPDDNPCQQNDQYVMDRKIFHYDTPLYYCKNHNVSFGFYDSNNPNNTREIIAASAPNDPGHIYYFLLGITAYIHNRFFAFDTLEYDEEDYNTKKKDCIIKYMLNVIDEDTFATSIYKINLKYNSTKDHFNIMNTFAIVSRNTIVKMCDDTLSLKDGAEIIKNLVAFTNDSIKFINKKYNARYDIIADLQQ